MAGTTEIDLSLTAEARAWDRLYVLALLGHVSPGRPDLIREAQLAAVPGQAECGVTHEVLTDEACPGCRAIV